MDISEIVTGLDATRTALGLAEAIQARDFSNAMKSMHEAALREQAVIELQKEILAAQAEQRALLQMIDALQSEIAELKAWNSDRNHSRLGKAG